MIRKNNKIKGIRIDDHVFVIVQFADDTNLFLTFELETIQETIDTLTTFENISGLKLNYKSVVHRIGSLKDTNAKFCTTKQLAWTNDPIKVPGIEISCSKSQLLELNYKNMSEKIKAVI